MADPKFARSGAAARKPATAPRAQSRAGTPASRPAELPEAAPTRPAPDDVTVRLGTALAALDDAEVAAALIRYRGQLLTDEEWAQAGDLVHLGMAAAAPATRRALSRLGWAMSVHARVHLSLGTSRTPVGWYGNDAVDATLTARRVGRGAEVYEVPTRYAATHESTLRRVSRVLDPNAPRARRQNRAHDPQEPLATDELEEVLDFCDAYRGYGNAGVGRRLARLVWLITGTGAKNPDLRGATGQGNVEQTEHAVVFTTAGPTPRRIPVLAACEDAVLAAAFEAGDRPLLDRIAKPNLADEVIRASHWDGKARFPLTAGRLRNTWLAAVLAGGAPFAGVLTAAGVTGEQPFSTLLTQLPPLDEVTYEVGLRCSTSPLPTAGQLLLPGQRHAAPLLPLRGQS